MTEQPPKTPQEIRETKDQLTKNWQQLPTEHQATMALVLVKDVIAGEYGDWIKEALALTILPIVDDTN